MNLSDFMPLKKTKPAKPAIEAHVLREAVGLKARLDAFALVRKGATHDEGKVLEKMYRRTQTESLGKRAGILIKSGMLPDELLTLGDPLTIAAQSPTVSLADARKIADKLSYLIMPFEYLDERSYQQERRPTFEAIKGFADDLEAWFDIYVLAPIPYYLVQKHVRAKTDRSLYAGKAVAQAFMAVTMSIPMFRAILGDVEDLRKRMDRLDARVTNAEAELKNLARRIDDLQAQAERQHAEAIMAQQHTVAIQRQLETLRARTAFIAYDPMMLAIPKGTNLQADGTAIIGPCWGPDFEDIVVTALGLHKIEGQRKLLGDLAGRWSQSNSGNDRSSYGFEVVDDR